MYNRIMLILFVVNALIATAVLAQPPYTLWTQTFGGSNVDYGKSVQQTTDGGYIIAGYSYSFGVGYRDVYLIKTDESGTETWSQTFGGSSQDNGNSVQQTTDGGYIIAGHTYSYGAGNKDVYLIKTDDSGSETWSQTFGGSYGDAGRSVQQTTDGGYIIAGYTESYGAGDDDVYLIKTDSLGYELWSRTFGGSSSDKGFSVQQTSDGGYIIAGYTSGYYNQNKDVYLIKTDGSGNEVWSQTFGGGGGEQGNSVQQTSDGGYIIVGYTTSYGAGWIDVYLIKTDASGVEQWSQTFGENDEEKGNSVQQTSDGGYIIAGYTESYGAGHKDVYLIRLGAEGVCLDVTITLVPFTWPIQIPAGGGRFEFYCFATNNESETITVDLWTDVLLPDGSTVGPLMGPVSVALDTGTTGWYRVQAVPATAPPGTYVYYGKCGIYPDDVWNMDSLEFEKLETGDGLNIGDWANWGDPIGDESTAQPYVIPQDFVLHPA